MNDVDHSPGAGDGWISSGHWSALCASARGGSHPAHVPNQDAVRIHPYERGVIAAMADGHGGPRHDRSALGARLAVEIATELVAAELGAREPADALRIVIPRVVDRWRLAVGEDQRRHPARGTLHAPSSAAYGSTLLVAVVGDDGFAFAQLGDGDMIVSSDAGPTRPVPPDARLVADETTSLCLPSAADDFRYAVGPLPDLTGPALVLVASDGLGKSCVDPGWWRLAVEDYAALLDQRGGQYLAAELPTWLAESAAVAGDDTTVAVLCGGDLTSEGR